MLSRIPLATAEIQAEKVRNVLSEFAIKIEIAGSIRRKARYVKDIEIVMVPDPKKLVELKAMMTERNGWISGRGRVGGRYVQLKYTPYSSVPVDLFFARPDNYGFILTIRTGSAEFSQILGSIWVKKGYIAREGYLYAGEMKFCFSEEGELFEFLEIPWVEPEERYTV